MAASRRMRSTPSAFFVHSRAASRDGFCRATTGCPAGRPWLSPSVSSLRRRAWSVTPKQTERCYCPRQLQNRLGTGDSSAPSHVVGSVRAHDLPTGNVCQPSEPRGVAEPTAQSGLGHTRRSSADGPPNERSLGAVRVSGILGARSRIRVAERRRLAFSSGGAFLRIPPAPSDGPVSRVGKVAAIRNSRGCLKLVACANAAGSETYGRATGAPRRHRSSVGC